MENTYNKIQYSEFTDNGKLNGNGQWVIRTETYTEAMAILEQIRKGTPGSTMPAQAPVVVSTPPQAAPVDPNFDSKVVCKFCGSDTEWKDFTSKAGNHVKGYFCLNKNLKCKPWYWK